MPSTITTDWGAIQRRSVDPFANVDSDVANRVHLCLGDSKMYFTGFDVANFEIDPISNMLLITINPGTAIMDYVSIEFTNSIVLAIISFPNLVASTRFIVLQYEYIKQSPAPIAILKVVDENDFDETKQLKLYTFNTNSWPSLIDISTWTIWRNQNNNWIDNRYSTGVIYRSGDVMSGRLQLLQQPLEKNDAANKKYVDDKIEEIVDPDQVLKTTGGVITGPILWDVDRIPESSKELISKYYADGVYINKEAEEIVINGNVQFTNSVIIDKQPIHANDAVNVQYVTDVIGSIGSLDAYLKRSGGTLTGIVAIPTNLLTASSNVTKLVNEEYIRARYLPLSGGTLTGTVKYSEDVIIEDNQCLISKEFGDRYYISTNGSTLNGVLSYIPEVEILDDYNLISKKYADDNYVSLTNNDYFTVENCTFNSNSTGSLKLNNGFELKWGKIVLTELHSEMWTSVQYPVSFEHDCLNISATLAVAETDTEVRGLNIAVKMETDLKKSQFKINPGYFEGGNCTIFYQAIGY